jgi:formate dehydrogenase subunit beta
MNELLTEAIREEAARLLREDVVDMVIGFEASALPLRARPAFIKRPEDAGRLVYNGFCQNNLATFLSRRSLDERIGIVCRGCESRAIRMLVSEHRHDRDALYLIGVPCAGIVDWRKVQREMGLGPEQFANVLQVIEQEDVVTVVTKDGEHSMPREDTLHDSCKRCAYPNPVGTDVVLGHPMREGASGPENGSGPKWASALAFESRSPEERYAYFLQESARCIRCYACREACPMCYCTECFVDHSRPRWTESMITPAGTQAWHIIRAFHQTGRCASCGACERACPMDIKMMYLTEKLNLDMAELYAYEVGESDDAVPPLATFALDDKERFVR